MTQSRWNETRIPQGKIDDTINLLHNWQDKTLATRTELQTLLGKLFHIAQCCKPARLFVSRMLDTLRQANYTEPVTLDADFFKDIKWFRSFLPRFNGIHLIDRRVDVTAQVDSCLTGAGGIWGKLFYAARFPLFIQEEGHPICHLEMLNIAVAVKLWSEHWEKKRVTVYCDNMTSVAVLRTGRGRDPFLLACARDVWLHTAQFDIELEIQHAPGCTLATADALSRSQTTGADKNVISSLLNSGYTQVEVDPYLFKTTLWI